MLIIENMAVDRGNGEQQFSVALPKLQLADGEVVAIQGKSGCGKSTLLEMIGLILQPKQLAKFQLGNGQNIINVQPLLAQNNQPALAKIRAQHLGFMLQNGGLLPFLTVEQNILLPNQLLDIALDRHWLDFLASELTVSHLLNKYPKQLSIGERQRIAFIRSVIHKPLLLLADEPTSALDPYHSEKLFDLILKLVAQQQISVLLVTHDWDLIAKKQLRTLNAELVSTQQAIFVERE